MRWRGLSLSREPETPPVETAAPVPDYLREEEAPPPLFPPRPRLVREEETAEKGDGGRTANGNGSRAENGNGDGGEGQERTPVESGSVARRRQTADGPLHRPFYIRFSENVSPETELVGRLHLRLRGRLFSGARGVDVYYPLGGRRADVRTRMWTDIYVDFRLHLNSLSFSSRKRTLLALAYPGVFPNHALMRRLVQRINDRGIYVKRLVESPARRSRTSKLNHHWDVVGRYYDGLFAVDFQIAIDGLVRYGGSGGRYEGDDAPLTETDVEISVTATTLDEAMRERVRRIQQDLADIVDGVFLPAAGDSAAPPETGLPQV